MDGLYLLDRPQGPFKKPNQQPQPPVTLVPAARFPLDQVTLPERPIVLKEDGLLLGSQSLQLIKQRSAPASDRIPPFDRFPTSIGDYRRRKSNVTLARAAYRLALGDAKHC